MSEVLSSEHRKANVYNGLEKTLCPLVFNLSYFSTVSFYSELATSHFVIVTDEHYNVLHITPHRHPLSTDIPENQPKPYVLQDLTF